MTEETFEPRDITVGHQSIWDELNKWADDHDLLLAKGSNGDENHLPFYVFVPKADPVDFLEVPSVPEPEPHEPAADVAETEDDEDEDNDAVTIARVARIRDAAEKLLSGDHTLGTEDLAEILGRWMNAEAVTLGEIQPFAALLNATIHATGGPPAYLRFGRNEDGSPHLSSDTSEHADAAADAVLES